MTRPLLALLGAILLAGCHSGFRARAETSRSVDHVPGAGVQVETHNGSVRLIGGRETGDVLVEARLVCGGATQSEADERVAAADIAVERRDDGVLHIEPVFPGGWRSGDGASLVVGLPDAEGVEVWTSNGSVRVDDLAGMLTVRTSNGGITVHRHRGDVDLDTSNGAVKALDIRGAATIDTSNGSIEATLGPDAVGPVDLESSNGSVTLRVGPAFEGRLGMRTSNGSVSVRDGNGRARTVEIERSSGSLVLGTADTRSRIRTSNGSVRIVVE